jgi:Lrp/AsnC family transcriptional regulator for asnA, asnC and gidA
VITRVDLDATDKAIVAELQVNGRLAYAKLAPLVGLGEAATRQRVNKLIERDVLQIVAVADPTMLGLRHQALLGIKVDDHVRAVADELALIDAVDYLAITAGRYDIVAEVFSADGDDFLDVVDRRVRTVPGVKDLEILTYLELVKQTYNWGTV